MTPETQVSLGVDRSTDVAIHDELNCRAYQLYERHDPLDGHGLEDTLRAELPRVVYAAAELARFAKGEVGDTRTVRAARVYLCALSSFLDKRNGGFSPGTRA